ncbi:MAG: hypothetical protein CL609_00645 [Anaerolineaceae bacterium]|nr:hypothetical protein [Anaerolineaceae bacterium]
MKKISSFVILLLFVFLLSYQQTAGATFLEEYLPAACAPLPASVGRTVTVNSVADLVQAVNTALSGDVILLADGTYHLNGSYLWLDVSNLTLRSASGNREAVILDGNYQTTEMITITKSNVVIADLTLKQAYTHPIHVVTDGENTLNTNLYNLHIIDPGEQAIKINPGTNGGYPDNGEIACSLIELTDSGRPFIRNNCYTGGVDGHQAKNWVVRDNTISGFWCESGLSEHAVHFWRGSRDTIVERNILMDNARGIGFGLSTSGDARTYEDDPCPETSGYVDHFGGTVKNNFIAVNDGALFNSEYGFDCGICLWNNCNSDVVHNTVYTANSSKTFTAIEWRFPNTNIDLYNNLVNDQLMQRDGASAASGGNLTTAQSSWFVNAAAGDLHLKSSATAAINQVSLPTGVSDDLDGQTRPNGSAADIGADEFYLSAPAAIRDLQLENELLSGGELQFSLTWTESSGTAYTEIRWSTQVITTTNWDTAQMLVSGLPAGTNSYSSSLPYSEGTLYFALKAKNSENLWSGLSNVIFWPSLESYLPVILFYKH